MQPDQSSETSLNYGHALPGRFYYQAGDRPLDGVTIKRAIGRGGFGEVYFAVTDAGKQIALKHITRAVEVERRGAVHCMNLKNPNLIALYDLKTNAEGATFILMEYVAGHSLKELIEQHPHGLPLSRVKSIMAGLINGVAQLHAHDIVHRDLKPANVFLDNDVVKVGDYGLSKSITEAGRDHSVSVGTCHYMAPEIRSGRYEKPVDTYALGIILYELLTGSPPFQGQTQVEVLMRHQFDQPDMNPVPPSCRAIVAKTLEKDPDHRPKDLFEILRSLEKAEHFEATATGPKTERVGDTAAETAHPRTFRGLFVRFLRGSEAKRQKYNSGDSVQSPDRRGNRRARSRLRPGEIVFEAPPWPTDRQRKRQLIRSLSHALIACWLVATPVGFMLGVNMSEAPNRIAFVAMIGSLVAGTMLIQNYFWEGWNVPRNHRRFVGLFTGSILGMIATVLSVWLDIGSRPNTMDRPLPDLASSFEIAGRSEAKFYFVALMIFIMTVPRWWVLVVHDRPSRWQLTYLVAWLVWSGLAVLAASLVSQFKNVDAISVAAVYVPGLVIQFVSTWDRDLAQYRILREQARRNAA